MTLYRVVGTAFSALLSLSACHDDTAPDRGVGFFQLESVNSVPLPYKAPPGSPSAPLTITGGALVLRPDATFTLSVDGLMLFLYGTYARAADEVRFTVAAGVVSIEPWTFTAPLVGDSADIVLSPPPIRLLYRRAAMPNASIRSGAYTLTEINGRAAPLILTDMTINGVRDVVRVRHDSITFMDGVFFRSSRAETRTVYFARGDSIPLDENVGTSYGSYTTTSEWLVLHRYAAPRPYVSFLDSLAIGPGTLTRTTGSLVERYTIRR
jgi:hypothetical protein